MASGFRRRSPNDVRVGSDPRFPPSSAMGGLAPFASHKDVRGLLSDEHFSVDGTQVAAWASMKSIRAKDGSDEPPRAGRTWDRDGYHRARGSHDDGVVRHSPGSCRLTLGTDKAYDVHGFVEDCATSTSRRASPRTRPIARTPRHSGYGCRSRGAGKTSQSVIFSLASAEKASVQRKACYDGVARRLACELCPPLAPEGRRPRWSRPDLAKPVLYWTLIIAPGNLVLYGGKMLPQWKGSALVSGLASRTLIRVVVTVRPPKGAERWDVGHRIRDVEVGPDGAL
jgi:hypothetical protein